MDQGPESPAADPVVVTGLGCSGTPPCDPSPWLKVRKNRKMMGIQDDLAVIATGRAVASAGLGNELGPKAGLYVAVGYIPFEEEEIGLLLQGSLEDGRFSMKRFSTEGYNSVHPLLTFRCLSNMPAFHVSVNFDVQGPYSVLYPGAGQYYLALEEAREALESGRIDVALVVGVAYQNNFLVRHHFSRLDPPVQDLKDGAGCLVLERASRAEARKAPIRARLLECRVAYSPEPSPASGESGADPALGPASLPVALATLPRGVVVHELRSRDGIRASSRWELTA